jgi:hypothetical protein
MRSLRPFGLALAILAAFFAARTSRPLIAEEPAAAPQAKSSDSHSVSSHTPRVFLLDPTVLQANLQRLQGRDKTVTAAVAQLEHDAQQELKAGPFTVLDKDFTPPSGDKHDYMSQAPYFWPDPTKSDGLPYIRRDGQRNPEINKYRNHGDMSRMINSVDMLALAYYFTGKEEYATKAAELLRAWFLNPQTKMNPNLQYAQAIPGISKGRGIGLIETASLPKVVDAIGLLQGSSSWTEADQHGMEDWLEQYLTWMLESHNGHDESAARNNHGTMYDLQTVSLAFFLGKQDLAKSILQRVGSKRIAVQIEPDGRQPLELVRTKAWGYSLSNLNGLMSLARLAEHVDIDLWNYETADGRSIRKAIDFLLPYAAGEKKWDYQQLGGWSARSMLGHLSRAAIKYNDDRYFATVEQLAGDDATSSNLLLRIGPLPKR